MTNGSDDVPEIGLLAAEEGRRVDFARLRAYRRQRLLDAMESQQVDVLMLGRPANVHYASGARQLWTAGARPFSPGCVVVRDPGRVHLLSVWDEGVPAEIEHNDLFGLSWNPATLMQRLGHVPGVSVARRIGTDAVTPAFLDLLPTVAPGAAVVDGTPAIRAARAAKSLDEIACIITATAAAEAGLAALVDGLVTGVTERQLLGVLAQRMATLGLPTLATDSVVCATPPPVLRHVVTDRPLEPGDLVVLNPSVLYAGYEGGLGRTWTVGSTTPTAAQRRLGQRARAGLAALLGECRPGRTGADLRRAWEATGERPMPVPLAHGIGLGAEPPVIGAGRGDSAELSAGSVLAVQAWVAEEGVGGVLERELVLVGDRSPELLTRFAHGPGGQVADEAEAT